MTEHILVIDDSAAITSLLTKDILPTAGYRATAASSGEEGLEAAQQTEPDLILCDLEMPGINGLDVLRSLKRKGHDIPAIIMTAFGSEATAASALRMGVKDYIVKPFTTEEILAAINRALTETRLRLQIRTMEASLKSHRRILSFTREISQAMMSDLDTIKLLDRMVSIAVHVGGARGGFIARHVPATNQLFVEATSNLSLHRGQVLPIYKNSALATALTTGMSTRSRSDTKHLLYTPLIFSRRTLGVICTLSPDEANLSTLEPLSTLLAGFTSAILELTRSISDNASLTNDQTEDTEKT